MESNEILHLAESLDQYIDKRAEDRFKSRYVKPDPYSSVEIKELAESLAKAQAEYLITYFNKREAYLGTQYSDLHNLQLATKEALAKYSLSVTQFLEIPDNGSTVLHTRLLHSSGQWLETRARIIPLDNNMDSFESTLCTHKRLAYMALVGITPKNDKGDDGSEKAMISSNKRIALDSSPIDFNTDSPNVISKKELEDLEDELEGFPDLALNLLRKYHINSLAELPATVFRDVRARVLETKKQLR